MKVLAIGNSFSNDAMRYLHGIAKADGVDMKTVNLFIGGCPHCNKPVRLALIITHISRI